MVYTGFLHLEQVREVRFHIETDQAFGMIQRIVADCYSFDDAGANLPLSFHEQRAVGVAVRPGHTSGKQRPIGFLRLRRKWLHWLAVDREAPAGQDTGVLEEDAMWQIRMNVAVGLRDTKG
jgi:hypothetical protein